jgi:serine/threonine protein phosphatase PrpC
MPEVRSSYGFPLSVAIHTDVGRVRTNNEDSSGQAWLHDGSLFVMVADGMGGHEAGEVASSLAVQTVEEVVTRDPEGDPRERLYHALLEANEAILDEGRRSGKAGMGTTSICAVLRGSEATVALVGDSRCYHIRKGHLVWRTIDHTRVQMLIDSGEIDEEQARSHPEAGMLTRALGHGRMADGRPLVPDVLAEPIVLEEYDALVLCSDGLHDLIEDWEIGRVVAGRHGRDAAEALVQLACERGGHDNVTVAVVIAGAQASEYDPAYVPPGPEPVEATYTGYDADSGNLDRQPRAPHAPAATGVFNAAAIQSGEYDQRAYGGGAGFTAASGAIAEDPPKKSNGMMIAIVVVVVLVLGVGGLALLAVLAGVGWSMFG